MNLKVVKKGVKGNKREWLNRSELSLHLLNPPPAPGPQ